MSKQIDLNKMNYEELTAHRKEVDNAIKTLDTRLRKEALEAVKKAAAEYGMSLKDLMGVKSDSKSKSLPKYQHPENPEMTWTGKGRRPKWVNEHVEAGGNVEELAI